jgi:hypothetical protein
MVNVEGKRVAVIRLPLSDEQKAFVRNATGADLTEALVAGLVDSEKTLENELVGDEASALADQIWSGNGQFIDNLSLAPKTEQAFLKKIGHELDRSIPNFAILR